MTDGVVDVVVVGGGAAGLSAALVLARARRRVVVVDAGEPRNAPADGVHGLLARDGTPPGELLATGRSEVRRVGGDVRAGRVVGIEHGFYVRLDDGEVLRARRVLVATGLRDELPDIPGVREQWGSGVAACPYCHGYEVRDQRLVVLATSTPERAVHQALLVRQWSPDVTLLTGTLGLSVDQHEQLAACGVRVLSGPVDRVVVSDGRVTGVALADGRVAECAAVFVAPRFVAHDALLAGLGCARDDDGWSVTDARGRTSVFGVYAAGNVADAVATVAVASAQGFTAAVAIDQDLREEDVERSVEEYRRAGGVFSAASERRVSERVLGDARHGI